MMTQIIEKIKKILIWSQKYTKTDMIYLVKNGSWLVFSNFYTVLCSLVSALIFANLLSPENYGNYKYIIALSVTISSFSLTAGMDKALIPAFAKGFDGMYKKAFLTCIKWSLIIPVICATTAIYYFLHGQKILAFATLIIGLFVPLQESAGIYAPYLQGKKNFRLLTLFTAIQTTLYLITITIALLTTANLLYIIFIYFLLNTSITTFYYFYTKKIVAPQNDNTNKSIITYAKHLTVIGFLSRIAAQADSLLVFHFLGAAPLAFYALAVKPIDLLTDVTKGLLKDISLPKLSQKTIQEIKAGLFSKMLRIFVLSVALVIIYIAISPFIFKTFFPKYLPSVRYSQILSFSLLLTMDALLAQTFFAHAKKKELYVINMSNAVIKIVLSLVLLPLYGLWGLIASRFIAQGIYFVTLLFLFSRYKQPT